MAWRPRFRLRLLLFLVTVICIWLGMHVRRTQSQRDAVAAIRQSGGWVRYDFQYPSGKYDEKNYVGNAESSIPPFLLNGLGIDFFHDVCHVSMVYSIDSGVREDNENMNDEAMHHLPAFSNLRSLYLTKTQATDLSLKYVTELPRLEHFAMWNAMNVSDVGMQHFRDLKHLRTIHISNSLITDDTLEIFAGLPHLETLSLQGNKFTDQGIKKLSVLRNLESLWVCGKNDNQFNRITDEGISHLQSLRKLRVLGVQRTLVTAEGIAAFQTSVPGCRTIWSKHRAALARPTEESSSRRYFTKTYEADPATAAGKRGRGFSKDL